MCSDCCLSSAISADSADDGIDGILTLTHWLIIDIIAHGVYGLYMVLMGISTRPYYEGGAKG